MSLQLPLLKWYDQKQYSKSSFDKLMNDIKPNPPPEIACHCSGTTKEKIKELVENQLIDLDGLSRKTGVCSGCGGCEGLLLELIAEYSSLSRSEIV